MPSAPEVDLLRPSDVARRTGLSKSRVYGDIREGTLPARVKKGREGRKGTIHITVEDYRAYLKNQFQPLKP